MRHAWSICGVIGVALIACTPAATVREPASTKFIAPTPDLTFDQLQNILERERFSKIDDLLAYLKPRYPTYMSRYIFMHDSRSLHGSTCPRVCRHVGPAHEAHWRSAGSHQGPCQEQSA